MKNEIKYLLKERKEFSSPMRWNYDLVGSTHDVTEAIAWKNSNCWRVFEVDEARLTEDIFALPGSDGVSVAQ